MVRASAAAEGLGGGGALRGSAETGALLRGGLAVARKVTGIWAASRHSSSNLPRIRMAAYEDTSRSIRSQVAAEDGLFPPCSYCAGSAMHGCVLSA